MGIVSNSKVTVTRGGGAIQAVITWSTDIPADSAVYYGVGSAFDHVVRDGGLVTSHSLTLPGLTEVSAYQARIQSQDDRGNTLACDAINPGVSCILSFNTPTANYTNPTGKYAAVASLQSWLQTNVVAYGALAFAWDFTGTPQASQGSRIEVTEFTDVNPGEGGANDFLFPGAPAGQSQFGEAQQMRVQFDIFRAENTDGTNAKKNCYLVRDLLRHSLRVAGQVDVNENLLLPAIPILDWADNPNSPDTTGIMLTLDLRQNGIMESYYSPTSDQPGVHHYRLLVRFQWYEMTH